MQIWYPPPHCFKGEFVPFWTQTIHLFPCFQLFISESLKSVIFSRHKGTDRGGGLHSPGSLVKETWSADHPPPSIFILRRTMHIGAISNICPANPRSRGHTSSLMCHQRRWTQGLEILKFWSANWKRIAEHRWQGNVTHNFRRSWQSIEYAFHWRSFQKWNQTEPDSGAKCKHSAQMNMRAQT